MLHLPRNLHMEVHKVLRLPRNLHLENLHMDVRSQSAAPATKSGHGGSQSALPATKSALQETSENSNPNGGAIPTMIRE